MHKENTSIYSIGTTARMTGVSVQTLRLYEREGLIKPIKSAGNQRLYSNSDIERIRCIRGAINKEKISISGIRHMQAMIPCWEIKQCPLEERLVCEAYNKSSAGCWTYKHEENVCGRDVCRDCLVYQLSGDCNKVKQLITGVYNHVAVVTENIYNNPENEL